MRAARPLGLTLAALQVAALAVLVGATPAAAYTQFAPSEWVIGAQKRVAYITIDGQTKSKNVADVLETLETKGASATFFMSGEWVAHHHDKAKLIRTSGHSLGNRGYGTARFTSLSDDAIRSSIERAQAALNDVGAYPRPFLRTPKGARDARVLDVAGDLGYRSVRWTHHPGGGLASAIKGSVVRKAQAGSIISLDIWRKSNRRALGGIIDGLRDHGFSLRTVETLTNVHPVRWDVTLQSGSSGAEVTYLQKTLKAISYPAGTANGSFGYETLQAVYAYEKYNRLTRDGVVTPSQMTDIAKAQRPHAPKRDTKTFIDVDVSRQVLREVAKGKVKHTLPVSTGNETYYTVDGQTYKAHTPRGDFEIERKIAGRRESRLGVLYWPNYFVGGFAIHGSDSVPTSPASHGCIRLPRYVEESFYNRTPIGKPVYVHD